jgi:Tol biopolymer transport system component
LCDVAGGISGAWGRDSVILFSLNQGGAPILRVSASGGAPTPATILARSDGIHGRPFFLPDGRHFLYRAGFSPSAQSGIAIYLASLDSNERKLLLTTDATPVLYSAGYLLFVREATLMAQSFDLRKFQLTGDAFPIAEQIQKSQTGFPNAFFSATENGALAYQTGNPTVFTRLLWFDRTGKQIEPFGDSAEYSDVQLSPDGKRVAVRILEPGKASDIWVYDVARALRTRFTFDSVGVLTPLWSRDGSQIIFNSRRKGHLDLYQKPSSGAGSEELLLENNLDKYPMSWSADGKFILYVSAGGPSGAHLFVLPLFGDRKPFPFANTKFNEGPAELSPDDRWVAYASDESGRDEIYVAPFPGPGGKWQVSRAGGSFPRWRRDGSEIFYLSPDDKVMAAAVNTRGSTFEIGAVRPLLEARIARIFRVQYEYDVTTDGQRFLINTIPEQTSSVPLTVVLNWTAGLKK